MLRSCSEANASVLSTTNSAGVKRGFAIASSGAADSGCAARGAHARRLALRTRRRAGRRAACRASSLKLMRRAGASRKRAQEAPPQSVALLRGRGAAGMDGFAALVPRLGSGAAPAVAESALALPGSEACAVRVKAPQLTFLQPARGAEPVWEQGIEYTLSLRVEGEAVEAVTFTLADTKTYSSWCVCCSPAPPARPRASRAVFYTALRRRRTRAEAHVRSQVE